jgi:hypothetical protein
MVQILITLVVAILISSLAAHLIPYLLYFMDRVMQGSGLNGAVHAVSGKPAHSEVLWRTNLLQTNDSREGNWPLYFFALILSMILMSFVIDTAFMWSFLALVGGIGSSFLLIHEGMDTERGSVFKLCFYVSGLILLYEEFLFVVSLFRG